MSCDVIVWKVKELVDLKIPISSLFKHPREDWHPDRINNNDGTVTYEIMDVTLTGQIHGDLFIVSSIEVYGEGSGTALNWVIKPALNDSTGRLIVKMIWENGGIDEFVADDGNIYITPIEL